MARKSSAAAVVETTEESTETIMENTETETAVKVKDKFILARSAQKKLDKLDRNREAFIATVVAKAETKAVEKFNKKRAKVLDSLSDEVRELLGK